MTSGKLVVGAAMIAPVGSNVRSFSAKADLCTCSRQRPWYVQEESQSCQNFTVSRNSSSAFFSDGGDIAPPSLFSTRTKTCDCPSVSTNSLDTPPRPSSLSGTAVERAKVKLPALKIAPLVEISVW